VKINFDQPRGNGQWFDMRSRFACVMAFAALAAVAPAARPMKGADIMLLKTAAEKGDADAQFLLGVQYQAGDGVKRDAGEAGKWLRRAAETGHAEAQAALGELYLDGQIEPVDEQEVLRWLQAAAAQGNAMAQARLGPLLAKGGKRGPAAATPVAGEWVKPPAPGKDAHAAVAPSPAATSRVAAGASQTGDEDPGETVRWSLILSGLRGPEALMVRGYLLENGLAMNRDTALAAAYYRKAAEGGLALAQYRVAMMYAEGRGAPQNPVEACAWLELAAAQGQAEAAAKLAQLLEKLTVAETDAVAGRVRELSVRPKTK
jgi:TPR repeat protein